MALDIWTTFIEDLYFQVAMLFATAMAASLVFSRLGLPKIVGQIAIGVIIGPSVLGIVTITENGDVGSGTDIITLLATFGSTIMLFVIGLECDFKEIYTKKNIAIAIGGISLPWLGGFVLAEQLLPDGSLAQSVFVGTALVATSVAITAGVLKEMGIISSGVAKTILGAAVVDDVLGMIVLAISVGIGTGTGVNLADLLWVVVAAILFVTLGTYLGQKLFVKVIGEVERRGLRHNIPESGFLLALAFAFIYAFVSHQIGISAIVGAFVAGTSFSGCEYRKQFKDGITFLEWAFAPIFFISLGILVDIRLPLEIWLFAIVLACVAMTTKVIGSFVPAKLFKMTDRESVIVGLGMAARLEVAMIIAVYGLSAEIIDQTVYSVIVVMGVISVLVAPTLLRYVARDLTKDDKSSEPPSCEK
jgi:Kef-type K+ transport system membrane component KefB